jgi:iron-sulfur cluster repair protein YtfE (RIC family)
MPIMRDEECRPFVEHLRREHRRLHEALAQTELALAEASRTDDPARKAPAIARRLSDLRDELARHYAEEEAGGCLEEALLRSPTVSPEVKRVQAEHPVFKQDMDRLVAKAAKLAKTPSDWAELRHDYHEIAAKLRMHEAAENRILLYGFGAEAMDEITEEPNISDLGPCGCRPNEAEASPPVAPKE